MPVRFTQSYINTIKPNPEKPLWITDAVTSNLKLYVGTSGAKVWYVYYRLNGRKGSYKIGPAGDVLTVAVARDMANDILARVAKGENPKRQSKPRVLLGDFLDNVYAPWVLSNRRSGEKTMNMLRSTFGFLFSRPIDEITLIDIEKWRMKRMNTGNKAATLNRCTAGLKAAINWGVKRGLIEENPIARLERLPQHDSDVKVRYLTPDERTRLILALDTREQRMREERDNHNRYLKERNKPAMPLLDGAYTDYLKPMILLSLHTGIRQNNLFSLMWEDIDFDAQAITLRAAVTKAGKTLHLPLNSVAFSVLTAWREQSNEAGKGSLVFPSPRGGGKLDNCKRAWTNILKEAEIENFRWHDMRHDFASQLVMAGIDLNTVRELMGHASLAMTLRYAHLAPENKLRAAEILAKL